MVEGAATAGGELAGAQFARVAVEEGMVCLTRELAGLVVRVRVPRDSYRGVTLAARREGMGARFEVVLQHIDPKLDVLLAAADDDSDIIALWRQEAARLHLPLLVEDADGRLMPVDAAATATAAPHRRGHPLRERRPRFLATRRTGYQPPGLALPANEARRALSPETRSAAAR